MTRITNTDTFITRAKEVHCDESGQPLYDYSKSIYKKSIEKLTITCPRHGDFEQSPNAHLSNHGCRKCGNTIISKKQSITHNEFVQRCSAKHPGLLDYSKTQYINWNTPAVFICIACKSEFTRPPSHMLGEGRAHGCVSCNGGVKDDRASFIRKAKEKHGDKFNYDLVEYTNSLTKVKIKCSNGHIFEQTPGHHLAGDECSKCRGRHRTLEEFITLSQEKFGTRFNYSRAKFVNMGTALTLICNIGHLFETVPEVHLRAESQGGCSKCAALKISEQNSYDTDEWLVLAMEKHKGIYDYSNVAYTRSQNKVSIICQKHGEFEQQATSHLMGAGCPSCGHEKIVASKLYSEDIIQQMILDCTRIHNGKYIYTQICRVAGQLYIDAQCNQHGPFTQRLWYHKNGGGCSSCVINYSKQQIEWLTYCSISTDYIQHALNNGEYRIPGTYWHADGYAPSTHTVYEFQGDFWHGNPKIYACTDMNPRTGTTYGSLYEKTQLKIASLKGKGYNVVELWESDWDRAKNAVVQIQRSWKLRH